MSDFLPIFASSDINGTVIWIVIVVGIAIVNYLREMFKKTGSDKDDGEEVDSSQARKVRQIIEEMKRGVQSAAPRQSRPSYQEPVAPKTPVSLNRNVVSKARPSHAVPSGWEDTPVETSARSSLGKMPDATLSAERSMSNLSDAERKALELLKSGKVSPVTKRSVTSFSQPADISVAGLRSRDALRMAVIYREILGEPKALKNGAGGVGF